MTTRPILALASALAFLLAAPGPAPAAAAPQLDDRPKLRARLVERLDRNGDGRAGPIERRAARARALHRRAHESAPPAAGGQGQGCACQKGGPPAAGPLRRGPGAAGKAFEGRRRPGAGEKDGKKRLTLGKGALLRFDRDGDGHLNGAERRAAWRTLRAARDGRSQDKPKDRSRKRKEFV